MGNAFTSGTERSIVDNNWGTHVIYHGRFNAPIVVIHVKAWNNLNASTRVTMKDVITFEFVDGIMCFRPIKVKNFTRKSPTIPLLIERAIGIQHDLITIGSERDTWVVTDKPTVLFLVLKYE